MSETVKLPITELNSKCSELMISDNLCSVIKLLCYFLKFSPSILGFLISFTAFNFRYFYPEFLPDPDISRRHPIREKLERIDMMRRRKTLDIPEFYVGTIMAVTASDPYAPGRKNRFVGICISRSGYGLRANFILRNVIDSHGVEIMYEMYNPSIQTIEVLKLEKRLDEELFYLRDAPPEYNTFPFDMPAELHPEGTPVPINQIKVKLKPRPWHERWERKELRGVQDLNLPERFYKRAAEVAKPYEKYDLMKQYRKLIPEEEQLGIMEEVEEHHKENKVSFRPDVMIVTSHCAFRTYFTYLAHIKVKYCALRNNEIAKTIVLFLAMSTLQNDSNRIVGCPSRDIYILDWLTFGDGLVFPYLPDLELRTSTSHQESLLRRWGWMGKHYRHTKLFIQFKVPSAQERQKAYIGLHSPGHFQVTTEFLQASCWTKLFLRHLHLIHHHRPCLFKKSEFQLSRWVSRMSVQSMHGYWRIHYCQCCNLPLFTLANSPNIVLASIPTGATQAISGVQKYRSNGITRKFLGINALW
ncbi:39S ribosomal protein L19, mitochondrial [Nymphon striatum]|nr:39S ribosomal protein L19, mitochondrial [Nymphon striatum]